MFVAEVYVPEELRGAEWPFDVPAVRHVAEHGLRFTNSVTILVGPNGTGKSTLIEAIAEAYGIDVRGGHAGRRYSSALEPSTLGSAMRLRLGPGAHGRRGRRGKGFFLRAETALGVLNHMSGQPGYGDDLDQRSHGESFLQVFAGRFNEPGLYLLDEPESGLSFESLLQLLIVLHRLAAIGGQVVCATHSPMLTALPGALILELSDHGIVSVGWEQLAMVQRWRNFLTNPEAFIHHLLEVDNSSLSGGQSATGR